MAVFKNSTNNQGMGKNSAERTKRSIMRFFRIIPCPTVYAHRQEWRTAVRLAIDEVNSAEHVLRVVRFVRSSMA